jgi:hypothetical protein
MHLFFSEKFETPGFTDYIQLRHPRFSIATNLDDDAGEEPANKNKPMQPKKGNHDR